MDNDQTQGAPPERAFGAEPEEALQAAEDYICLSVATIGRVVKLERVPLTATVAEVVNSVRREPLADWSEVALALHQPGEPRPKTLEPHQSLREAGAQSGDTLIHAYPVRSGSGWQEAAFYLAGLAGAGVIGGGAYDLLKTTLRSAAGRWRKGRGSTSAPSLSPDEVIRIAQACLSMNSGIDLQDLRAVSIAPAGNDAHETWIVSVMLPHRDVEVKVSVPADGPEHAMVFIDHHALAQRPDLDPDR